MERFLTDIAAIAGHPYILCIVLIALVFDFINGFHDAANSVATIVGTRVLRPRYAVLWAAFWNFAAAWVFGVHVANTVAKWIHPEFISPDVILAGLSGAIIWNLITWLLKLPTSSSHALLGGFVGAAFAGAWRFDGVVATSRILLTIEFIVISPAIGFVLGLICMVSVALFLKLKRASRTRTNRFFRFVQLGSAATYSLGHGTNDAQKTMGIIVALLFASIWSDDQAAFAAGNAEFPFWIVLVCHGAIGLGTLCGGWRIIHTMASCLTKLVPSQGACAETAAAMSLFLATWGGIAVSTTHTIVGAIVGVGIIKRFSAVRWGLASQIVWAWIFTIPASALLASLAYALIIGIRNLSAYIPMP